MKKFLIITLAAVMLLTGASALAADMPADDLTQHRSMTAFLALDDYRYFSTKDQSPLMRHLADKFNFTIEFQHPPTGGETDSFNVMLGSGSYTDLMEISYSTQIPAILYEDGVIIDLAPYLETYMPNYYAYLHAPENKDVYMAMVDAQGRCLTITTEAGDGSPYVGWGGMVYRRDILETMTGGNVAFPSGHDEPVTVADWDYMLGLMKAYFDATGMVDTAALILPYQGCFPTGELVSGFGTGAGWQVVDGKVSYGPTTPEFYNYLKKMNEWYGKGYIYQDFASRVNDLFFQPNPALTYGGAAGVFFGGYWQLAGKMSMPEYGLNMDVRAASAPIDEANGQTAGFPSLTLYSSSRVTSTTGAWCVSSTCSFENMVRFMTWADYLFTEEGSMLKKHGFTGDLAANNELYVELGLEKGTYWFDENSKYVQNPKVTSGELELIGLSGSRLPGMNANRYEYALTEDSWLEANAVWSRYGDAADFPSGAFGTAEEEARLVDYYNTYNDYQLSAVVKFIMGTEELNESTYAAYVAQMNKYGVEESIKLKQTIYDRYMAR